VRHEKGLVGMGDLVEPASLGVEVTAQQEVGSNLGGTQQLVRQSKKRVTHLCTRRSFTLGRNVNSTKHGILSESKETTFATDQHTLKALRDLMQSQEVCTRVGSHNSHSKTTPADAAMGNACVSYETHC